MEGLKALIEIPQGDDRRRHMKYDKSGFVDLGPIKDVIVVNGGVMPVHYGYIIDTINHEENEDIPEEVDVLVISNKKTAPGDVLGIKPIALLTREDRDDKVVAVESGDNQTWENLPSNYRKLLLDYFGYKSKIVLIGSAADAENLIKESVVKS